MDQVTSDAALRGVLIYAPVTGSKYQYDNQYLVLRGIGIENFWQKQSGRSITYYIESDFRNPQVSVDGRYLFLRSGYTGRNDGYGLYAWNLKTGNLTGSVETHNVSYDALSPDGKFFAVAEVLNTQFDNLQMALNPWSDNGPARLHTFEECLKGHW